MNFEFFLSIAPAVSHVILAIILLLSIWELREMINRF